MELIRLTQQNVSKYIGYEILFKTRKYMSNKYLFRYLKSGNLLGKILKSES